MSEVLPPRYRLSKSSGRRLFFSAVPGLASALLLYPQLLQAQEPSADDQPAPGASNALAPFNIDRYLNNNDTGQPYPGKPWTKSIISPVDLTHGNIPWEKIVISSPRAATTVEHTSKNSNWNFGPSVLGTGEGNMLEIAATTYILGQFELNGPTSVINAGLIFRNEADRTGAKEARRRLVVGAWDQDIYFAYWNGNSEGKYEPSQRGLAQITPNEDGKLLVNTGIVLDGGEGNSVKIILPNSQLVGPFDLGASLFDPTGKKQLDIAVSTTEGVTNTLKSLVVLRPESNSTA